METFRTFKDAPAAEDLAAWLRLRSIPAVVTDTSAYFDPSFAHSILSREWSVRIPAEDFTRATDALNHFYEQRLNSVPLDYYLLSYTDDELEEILRKPDEWGDLDYALARQLMRERGKGLTDSELLAMQRKRYEALSMPEEQVTAGYVFWGYTLSVVGGFLGSLLGWYLMNSQKLLPDGKKLPRFPETARLQGRKIFWLGVMMTVLFGLLRLYVSYVYGIGDFS